MNRQLDVSHFRELCPDVLGAAWRAEPELTVGLTTGGGPSGASGVAVRAAFRRCYGLDVRRVRFVPGLSWPAEGWCEELPEADGRTAEYVHVPPAGQLERELVEFWEELLDMRGLGVTDSFWECGGDSLAIVELIAFLDRAYGARLGYFDIGDDFTVARLATLLRERSPR
ncbi:phosphopantetheine-binding protein [Kitasatospora sp. NPDC002227]|uniref:acyl carrier protein n=1 Tax=Kitasatospora sp. NPDC002227 TaxID=3154773 RepID=UPI003322D64B